ncbi:MAG TPA: carboxypeptidase-like regulatory domain-containing protein [Bryobacteraceae bacterium]|nr:carboxypeptidase-like regulatory domain-containing protein [Bryobacteraceae bacterium]
MRSKLTFLLLGVFLSAAMLLGQTSSGSSSVTGRVTDATGAVIPGAVVTLTDTSTNISRSTQTNPSGLYLFNDVNPGTYDISVTNAGFRKAVIRRQTVLVATTMTVDVQLEVGAAAEVVEVTAQAGAELQTLNATMGTTVTGQGLLDLPTINRDVNSLLFLQPMTAPTFNAEGNITSGQVAGNMSDQNTYYLDGGNATSDFDGDNGTYVGSRSAVVPTPMESVEEMRVNTNNMTADFGFSGGGQMLLTTKHGTNQYHGSIYDYFQSDVLSSNDWYNNFHGIDKPKSHYNRFGGSFGGPLTPEFLGGKTYIYMNYEGERYPRSGPIEKLVPAETLKQGILQFRDANGTIQQYNLATSTACGPSGNQQCDPRAVGISPSVSQLWSKYEPPCNDLDYGDHGLNTCGFIGQLSYPLSTNFGVVRIDHDFGAKWRWYSSYRYFREINPTTNQVDIGGILPGDKLGQPATASGFPVQPRYFVTGLTGTITPNLTNELHLSYTRNQWQYLRVGALPQLPGLDGALAIGGETSNPLMPYNVDTQNARARLWAGHDYGIRDSLSWLKGTHLLQFGGEYMYDWWKFDRYDNVVGGLTQLVEAISNSGVNIDQNYRPMACSDAVSSGCLPSSFNGSWNSLYAQVLGLASSTSVVVARSGANLAAQPLGSPVKSVLDDPSYSLFFNDSWKIKPNLTLSYGLNWTIQMPPIDKNGAQDILTTTSGSPILINTYVAQEEQLANMGQVYNPTLAFTPVGDLGAGNSKYPYHPFYGGFGPRAALAWNPEVKGGFLEKLLGNKATVVRVGFGRSYSRSLAAGLVSTSVLGDGFLQPVGCQDPNTSGQCTGAGQVTPSNVFRIGVDGTNAPVGAITPTLQSPVAPGVNAPYSTLVESLDQAWKPTVTNSIDFSIQRQLKGNVILEVGYVGVYATNLYQGMDFGSVPFQTKLGGQTFAQAYDNIYFALAGNKTPAAQPFFEQALKGSSYCGGFANCTQAVATNESGNVLTQCVTCIWSDLDTSWTSFGPALASTTQCYYCYAYATDGFSNYNALVVTAQKRYSQGLTLNANFTYSHALGIASTGQSYTLDNASDIFNLNTDYGPEFFDRKFVFNLMSTYSLPFGKGHKIGQGAFLSRILGGWTLAPIFTFGTGLPLPAITGSCLEYGQAWDPVDCATAIPVGIKASSLSNTPHFGVNSDGNIGVNGDPAQGGAGVNIFSNPSQVYNEFRPLLVGIDGRSGITGILRGQVRWNMDLGLTKDTQFTERVGAQIYVQAFNVLNHMQWGDPGVNLQDPLNFGVIGGQYGALTLGGSGASANYTRIIQLGLRLHF